jgi:hypothetical protein
MDSISQEASECEPSTSTAAIAFHGGGWDVDRSTEESDGAYLQPQPHTGIAAPPHTQRHGWWPARLLGRTWVSHPHELQHGGAHASLQSCNSSSGRAGVNWRAHPGHGHGHGHGKDPRDVWEGLVTTAVGDLYWCALQGQGGVRIPGWPAEGIATQEALQPCWMAFLPGVRLTAARPRMSPPPTPLTPLAPALMRMHPRLIKSVHMGQIRLLVYVRNDLLPAVADVQRGSQPTGEQPLHPARCDGGGSVCNTCTAHTRSHEA